MNWKHIQNIFNGSLSSDYSVSNWLGSGTNVYIRRCQEWKVPGLDDSVFISPTSDVRDLYLDYPWIAAKWCESYGTPTLADFVTPMTRQEIIKQFVSLKNIKPWRVFHGNNECQYMYKHILEILDISMRLVCGKYPRGINNRFFLGDAGCSPGKTCPNHGGAHNALDVIDLNYCTFEGFNLTHYIQQRNSVPVQYKGNKVNIWRDPFPMRRLKEDIFDTEKNFSLYELLNRIYIGNLKDFKVSQGLLNHFNSIYSNAKDVLQGDDHEIWCHHWHTHLHMCTDKIDYNTEMITI